MSWWLRAVLSVAFASVFIFVLSALSPSIARLVRFLALVPRPGTPVDTIRISSSVKATVIRAGANPDDPGAARVLSEDVNGNLHVEEVLPPGADVVTAMREMVPRFVVPVRSLRAMRGNEEVGRWKPSPWQRCRLAAQRARVAK